MLARWCCLEWGADDHVLRGSDSTVLTATGLVNREGQILTPRRSDTPQPIAKKFVAGDYVGEWGPLWLY